MMAMFSSFSICDSEQSNIQVKIQGITVNDLAFVLFQMSVQTSYSDCSFCRDIPVKSKNINVMLLDHKD